MADLDVSREDRGVSAPAKEKSRINQTVRDMTLSMLVVGLFVAFLYVMVLRPTGDPVRQVDTAGAAALATSAGAFEILTPEGLPEGWQATSARFRPGPVAGTGSWFNGYVNPDGQFVAVAQQDYDQREFLREYIAGAQREGARPIGDAVWNEYFSDADGEWTLVREGDDPIVLVTGTVPFDELAEFAARLT